MLTKKLWGHAIEMKGEFVRMICAEEEESVSIVKREERREKREEMYEFIEEQLRKGHIRPSKLSQIAPVFFVGKKNSKK